jgi:hypothetical protein
MASVVAERSLTNPPARCKQKKVAGLLRAWTVKVTERPTNKQRTRTKEKPVDDLSAEWRRKGATLSDKTARKQFGLSQDEIIKAIRAGKLQYRYNSIHGNPFLRLLRGEVEELVTQKHGGDYLKDRQAKTELARINLELKRLKAQMAELEVRKSRLVASLEM